MTTNTVNYWIHGLGLSSEVLPKDVLADDIFGHGQSSWNMESYNFLKIIERFCHKIPKGAHVTGHGLGGHIAINVALLREDITVTATGMLPADSREEAFYALHSNEVFQNFFLSKRSYNDLVDFSKLLTRDLADQSHFINAMLKQDPLFNEALYTTGFDGHDWNENKKIESLGKNRFKLILNDQDPLIKIRKPISKKILVEQVSQFGHCLWKPENRLFKRQVEKQSLSQNF